MDGLITVLSSAVGTVAGNWLYTMVPFENGRTTFAALLPASGALVGVAVAGWLVSLLIKRLPAADATRPLPPNPITETWRSLRLLSSNVVLLRTALGMAFFWFLASLANMNIDTFGNHELDLTQEDIGPLLGVLVLGVAIGSVLAGLWSRGRVELGIVPLGAVRSRSVPCSLSHRRQHRSGGHVDNRHATWSWSGCLRSALVRAFSMSRSNHSCSTAVTSGPEA
jgi:acyl-[acyl-carrier-protein]-phospholipid O-acyltransferase/long-chain-fatty-acid--[acyl-carrier-protein] ligase